MVSAVITTVLSLPFSAAERASFKFAYSVPPTLNDPVVSVPFSKATGSYNLPTAKAIVGSIDSTINNASDSDKNRLNGFFILFLAFLVFHEYIFSVTKATKNLAIMKAVF